MPAVDALTARVTRSPLARLVLVPAGAVAAAAALRWLLDPVLGNDAPLPLFFLATAAAAYLGGLSAGVVTTALGLAAGIALFIVPKTGLPIDAFNLARFVLFVAIGMGVSALAEALQRAKRDAAADAARLRLAQDVLTASEQRFASIIASAMDAIISVDAGQRIILFNPAAERLFGMPAADALGQPLEILLPPRFRAAHAAHLRAFGARNQTTRSMGRLGTLYGLRANGEEFPIEASISHVELGGQQLYTVILRDVTERLRLEAEREQMYRATAAANRTKDEFLATLSHELRTPLNVMLGWVWRLRQGPADPKTLERALEVLERNARSQQRLIEDLLDLSRISRGEMGIERRPVDLGALVLAVVEASRPSAEAKQLNLTARLPEDAAPVVAGDGGRLQQVLWNLLSNSIKFTPNGGSVAIHLEVEREQAVLVVSDTGVGIAPDFLPHVFERFRQYDSTMTRSFGGVGLGLSIVQHIVILHGGQVKAESPGIGMGATFTVRLPLLGVRSEAATPGRRRRRTDDQGRLEGVRVVAVGQEASTRDLLRELVSGWGADVRLAASTDEALELVTDDPPDLIVSDVAALGPDGYALMRRLRTLEPSRGGGLPALALTGHGGPEDRARVLAAGFQGQLTKPIDPDALRSALSRLLAPQ